jgi:hypothetical protein
MELVASSHKRTFIAMALREALRDKHVYLDTSNVIYILEGYEAFQQPLLDIRDGLVSGIGIGDYV